MLNQVFAKENYIKVIQYLNRKGSNFEREYFEDIYAKFMKDYMLVKEEMSGLKKDSNRYQDLLKQKEQLRENKNEKILKAIANIKLEHITIQDRKHYIHIEKIDKGQNKKALYIINEKDIDYDKKLQQELNLRLLYKNLLQVFNIKQANRDIIIQQIKSILMNNLSDLYLYRLDIKSFYESIDHNILMKKLEEKTRLLYDNVKLVKDILNQYSKYNEGKKAGIPRGISISALLGEIYLQDFDECIKDQSSTVYYARYVDDIFIVSCKNSLEVKIKNELDKLELEYNTDPNKYQKAEFRIDTKDYQSIKTYPSNFYFDIEYLGYKFEKILKLSSDIKTKKVINNVISNITISGKRFGKYKKKIDRCFEIYNNQYQDNLSEEKKQKLKYMLKERLQYLFQNSKIVGYAKVVFMGAYYSNRHIINIDKLKKLDKYIDNQLQKINVEFRSFDKKFVYYFSERTKLKVWDIRKQKKQKKYKNICRVWK